ncbi:hypothetical protein D9758_017956 [Tetrapyrgos nigripes]|uniref:Uncharacterized protein n=1 Tax=Tetrapyrgos nigripes TaxID=182062 RepID=A0A8H5BT84_9AGAR|nr:hypothetical protein D9758_017956 [Tetrapyrgos nigripes]
MQLKLNRIFVAVSVMLITGQFGTAQGCQTFDDCPGSDVCCLFGAGASACIQLDQCINGQCVTIAGGVPRGSCDA